MARGDIEVELVGDESQTEQPLFSVPVRVSRFSVPLAFGVIALAGCAFTMGRWSAAPSGHPSAGALLSHPAAAMGSWAAKRPSASTHYAEEGLVSLAKDKGSKNVNSSYANSDTNIMISKFEFVNQCNKDIVMEWNQAPHTTPSETYKCVIAKSSTVTVAKNPQDAPGSNAPNPLKSCEFAPRTRTDSAAATKIGLYYKGFHETYQLFELSGSWGGIGSAFTRHPNFADHHGFSIGTKVEFLELDSEKLVCYDAGAVSAYPDHLVQCPASPDDPQPCTCGDGLDVVKKGHCEISHKDDCSLCNNGNGLCMCQGENLPTTVGGNTHWCQATKPCAYIRDHMYGLYRDGNGRTHACKGMSSSSANEKVQVPNEWWSDTAIGGAAFGAFPLGILLHPSCSEGKNAKLRITTCPSSPEISSFCNAQIKQHPHYDAPRLAAELEALQGKIAPSEPP